jgi:hypothetical protein
MKEGRAMLEIVKRYLAGDVPLARVFFHDMLLIGTLVNIATGLAMLAAFSLDLPLFVAVAIFLSPQPYNIILCVSVWRSAARQASRWSDVARIGTVVWFPVMLII